MSPITSGLSVVGLMVLVVASGMATSIGLHRVQDARVSVEAATVAADLRAVVMAAQAYEASTGNWPPDAGRGEVPQGLAPFLMDQSFSNPKRELEWDKFGVTPSGSGYIAGITLNAADKRLRFRVIAEMRNELPYFVAGGLVTWVLLERPIAPGWSLAAGTAIGD